MIIIKALRELLDEGLNFEIIQSETLVNLFERKGIIRKERYHDLCNSDCGGC